MNNDLRLYHRLNGQKAQLSRLRNGLGAYTAQWQPTLLCQDISQDAAYRKATARIKQVSETVDALQVAVATQKQ